MTERTAPEDPGRARDRTALAWTRSALNIAGSGALIARAGFEAHIGPLGIASAIATGAVAFLTWRHGQTLNRERGLTGRAVSHQMTAFALLTAATVIAAATAVGVTVAT